jgi:class 3 adenylate cyclase/tetratricopeptide (TPR) repeat protein
MAVCASCGQENPPIAKFCLACGSPLAEAEAPSEERRLITAVFTDVVGSTATAESMDPEDVHQRLQPYFELVRRELEHYGGTLEKYIGDAVVAMFGAPVAHEDDPERAVRAALAIRDRLHDLNESDDWLDLSIRVGVNTGEALLVMGSNPSLEYGMAAGDAINTAARIQSAAPVNGVMVGELTYQATREVIEYEKAESIAAKGKSEPVPVWVAVRPLAVAERGRAVEGHLVGREAELERLLEVWNAVGRERLPGLAFVTGQPGIGKSGLLHEFAARISVEGDAHWGGCLPYGEGITYWPVMDVVKDAAGILQSDDTTAIAAKLGALLESFGVDDLEELRTMAAAVSNLLGVATTPRGTYQAAQITQAELHWGIRRVLQMLARERPVALVLEDLHWAEPTLIELVQFLLEEQADMPLLVLASGRPEAADANPGLIREGARACNIRLEGLTDEGARALLRELLGSEELANAPVADTLLRTAGGNPLFLEETVQALRDAGMVDDEAWHLPDDTAELPTPTSLQGLIGSRLDQLARPEKRLAQNASVVGTVFWPGAVVHLQGDAASPDADLVGKLRALEQRDLVRQHDLSTVAGELEYAFKHILIRDVAYGQLPKGRRMELHMRFADWVKALPTEEFIEIVAWHLERSCKLAAEVARTPVDPPVAEAVAALSAAADKAERREGIREADRYYARALELVGEEPSAQALEARLGRAGTLQMLGDLKQADELLIEVADAATGAGRADLRARALILRANIAAKRGQAAEARSHAAEAESIARGSGDRSLEVRAVYIAAYVRSWFEDVGDAPVEDLRRGLVLAEELGDKELRLEGHKYLGALLYNLGDLAGAEEQFVRYSELLGDVGQLRDEARVTFQLGLVKYHQGDLAEAERLGLQALDWLDRTGDSFWALLNLRALALCAVARSDLGLAEERLRQAIPLALDVGGAVVVETYRRLVEVLIGQDRLDDARALAAFAWRDLPEEDAYARAAGLLMDANLRTAEDQSAVASECFAQALRLLEEQRLPLDLAEARLAFGRALRRFGDKAGAQAQLAVAREDLARMGACGLVAEIDRELAELLEGPVSPAPLASL